MKFIKGKKYRMQFYRNIVKQVDNRPRKVTETLTHIISLVFASLYLRIIHFSLTVKIFQDLSASSLQAQLIYLSFYFIFLSPETIILIPYIRFKKIFPQEVKEVYKKGYITREREKGREEENCVRYAPIFLSVALEHLFDCQ